MDAKEYIAKGYELFAKGDMVAYFDTIDDDGEFYDIKPSKQQLKDIKKEKFE